MKKEVISKSEVIASYMEEMKKDLIRNLDSISNDDISMASIDHISEEEDCLAGESQSINSNEEVDIETVLQQLKDKVEESSIETFFCSLSSSFL